jgi:dienelactone hydrolase
LIRIGLLVYLGLLLVLASIQTALIFPGRATQGRADSYYTPAPDEELVTLMTPSGARIKALFGPALEVDGSPLLGSRPRPAVLYFYGNGMCMAHCRSEFDGLRRQGVHVLIPDYLGYGMSEGQASEAGFYQTADAAWDYLTSRPDVDRDRMVVSGWSIGGAVAIDLASRKKPAALMTFCTFTSLKEMSARSLPFFPAGLLLRHRFDSLSKIAGINCPILMGHGEEDSLVPYPMMARLARAAGGPVETFTTEADHNDFWAIGPGRIFERIGEFLDQAVDAAAGEEVAEAGA